MENHKNVIDHLIFNCGNFKAGERLLILCDPTTKDLAALFRDVAEKTSPTVTLLEIPVATAHGKEPPAHAAQAMLESDLIMSICQYSLAHSKARIEAGKHNARFLSMPCYTWELLEDPALLVDYKKQSPVVRRVSDLFTNGSKVQVKTDKGTDVVVSADGRIGNYCPGFVQKPGDLGSPPDIEANVSPVEDRSEGKIVIDGSITCAELGLLQTPVVLTVKNGRITRFESENAEYVRILDKMFGEPESKRRVLAECGVGLNPLARLTGSMLTDEGASGCVHFGFGANHTVGGKNEVDFHLDFVMRDATLIVDGTTIIDRGVILK